MNIQDIFNIIVANVREVKPDLMSQDIIGEDNLNDLGLHSVDRSEVVMMTLEKLNLVIPLTQTYGPNNIGELAELLYDKKS